MSKKSIKEKTRTEVRAALTQGTLFTKVELNDREVTFTLATEFEAQCHHRIINQVLNSLRNSSASLKQAIYNIHNVNRYPKLTLTKTHRFADSQAVLKALVAAQNATVTLQTSPPQIQTDEEFWDFLDDKDFDLDLGSPISSGYTSRSSSSEDFFESLFADSSLLLFGFISDTEQSIIDAAITDSAQLAINTANAAQETQKENIDLGYVLLHKI